MSIVHWDLGHKPQHMIPTSNNVTLVCNHWSKALVWPHLLGTLLCAERV
jgi:hypothetical protein